MAPRADHLLHTEDILAAIEAQHPRLALVLLGGVNYLTGQVTLASYTAGWARATSPGSVAARDASGPEPGPGPNPHRHRTPPPPYPTILTFHPTHLAAQVLEMGAIAAHVRMLNAAAQARGAPATPTPTPTPTPSTLKTLNPKL